MRMLKWSLSLSLTHISTVSGSASWAGAWSTIATDFIVSMASPKRPSASECAGIVARSAMAANASTPARAARGISDLRKGLIRPLL